MQADSAEERRRQADISREVRERRIMEGARKAAETRRQREAEFGGRKARQDARRVEQSMSLDEMRRERSRLDAKIKPQPPTMVGEDRELIAAARPLPRLGCGIILYLIDGKIVSVRAGFEMAKKLLRIECDEIRIIPVARDRVQAAREAVVRVLWPSASPPTPADLEIWRQLCTGD
jgi:hypothetical protein